MRGKHERRFAGFGDKIIPMYSRGMSTREIETHLREVYGVGVSSTYDAVFDSSAYALVPMMAAPQTGHLLEAVNRQESSAF